MEEGFRTGQHGRSDSWRTGAAWVQADASQPGETIELSDEQRAVIERAAQSSRCRNNPLPDEVMGRLPRTFADDVHIPWRQRSMLAEIYGGAADVDALLQADWEAALDCGAAYLFDEGTATVSFPLHEELASGSAVSVSIRPSEQDDGKPWYLSYVPDPSRLTLMRDFRHVSADEPQAASGAMAAAFGAAFSKMGPEGGKSIFASAPQGEAEPGEAGSGEVEPGAFESVAGENEAAEAEMAEAMGPACETVTAETEAELAEVAETVAAETAAGEADMAEAAVVESAATMAAAKADAAKPYAVVASTQAKAAEAAMGERAAAGNGEGPCAEGPSCDVFDASVSAPVSAAVHDAGPDLVAVSVAQTSSAPSAAPDAVAVSAADLASLVPAALVGDAAPAVAPAPAVAAAAPASTAAPAFVAVPAFETVPAPSTPSSLPPLADQAMLAMGGAVPYANNPLSDELRKELASLSAGGPFTSFTIVNRKSRDRIIELSGGAISGERDVWSLLDRDWDFAFGHGVVRYFEESDGDAKKIFFPISIMGEDGATPVEVGFWRNKNYDPSEAHPKPWYLFFVSERRLDLQERPGEALFNWAYLGSVDALLADLADKALPERWSFDASACEAAGGDGAPAGGAVGGASSSGLPGGSPAPAGEPDGDAAAPNGASAGSAAPGDAAASDVASAGDAAPGDAAAPNGASTSAAGAVSNGNAAAPSFGILKNYLTYTFYRLRRQEPCGVLENEEAGLAAFNTGLVDETFEPIYAVFTKNDAGQRQPWKFRAFCQAGSSSDGGWGARLSEAFNPLPARAKYFSRKEDLLFDTSRPLDVNYDHILLDNMKRLPSEFLLGEIPQSDVETIEKIEGAYAALTEVAHAQGEKRREAAAACDERFSELRAVVEADPKLHRRLKNRLRDAIDLARRRAEWNFRTAVPCYYPTTDKMSLLLPLDLTDDGQSDDALVVELLNSGRYIARTILTMPMAYQDARLVCRPESDWLNTSMAVGDWGGLEDGLDEE